MAKKFDFTKFMEQIGCAGSQSKAARELGVTQITISRAVNGSIKAPLSFRILLLAERKRIPIKPSDLKEAVEAPCGLSRAA